MSLSVVTESLEALAIVLLVLLNAWQHNHHEKAVERWRIERHTSEVITDA